MIRSQCLQHWQPHQQHWRDIEKTQPHQDVSILSSVNKIHQPSHTHTQQRIILAGKSVYSLVCLKIQMSAQEELRPTKLLTSPILVNNCFLVTSQSVQDSIMLSGNVCLSDSNNNVSSWFVMSHQDTQLFLPALSTTLQSLWFVNRKWLQSHQFRAAKSHNNLHSLHYSGKLIAQAVSLPTDYNMSQIVLCTQSYTDVDVCLTHHNESLRLTLHNKLQQTTELHTVGVCTLQTFMVFIPTYSLADTCHHCQYLTSAFINL